MAAISLRKGFTAARGALRRAPLYVFSALICSIPPCDWLPTCLRRARTDGSASAASCASAPHSFTSRMHLLSSPRPFAPPPVPFGSGRSEAPWSPAFLPRDHPRSVAARADALVSPRQGSSPPSAPASGAPRGRYTLIKPLHP
eukprot:1189078-Prorocentrum_minimum.AAC.1